ncbi:UDP-N-acetylmuramate dehydrogenase [Pseudidiomarina sp.]|uniref:UDP-N-acetylmuramate dehydrogenase n=1 Tax=Pseudidiomarina sp. TaxID=2081707 RepID=UPI00299F3F68|nr:UDP-N-acetylmuramate dehydrogenase [Pseudidiomarina sp.]MDX1705941.1 UDP-N-acetylmuramate dehydrogenase [Pseudidiomarina sp.]
MLNIQTNIPLAPLHTFRLPACADSLLCLRSADDCQQLPDTDYHVLGGGSNTIFTTDFKLPLVKVEIKGIVYQETDSSWEVTAGAGENWHQLVCSLLDKGIFGFENLALIPGTVGAAPVQNIGAYGVEISDFVASVQAWDRQDKNHCTLSGDSCNFAYRDSTFKRHPGRWLITSVTFRLPKQWQPVTSYGELQELGSEATALQVFQRVIEVRQGKLPDPAVQPNAGSFFKNPVVSVDVLNELQQKYAGIPFYPVSQQSVKLAAGWLIEQAGWKGKALDGVAVHSRQALVLVNQDAVDGKAVILLARSIKASIAELFGVELEAEVRILGKRNLIQL